MKILCKKCKRPVGYSVGRLIQLKRGKDRFSVIGKDYDILATCSSDNCNEETNIIIRAGMLKVKDLLLEGSPEALKEDKNEEENVK